MGGSYALGWFEFDVRFTNDYPASPPKIKILVRVGMGADGWVDDQLWKDAL
jgi:ubiquitin-protein ligase